MPCWYCDVRLVEGNSKSAIKSPRRKTIEHLVPVSRGGGLGPENVKHACAACNSYVGSWEVSRKRKFRQLMHEIGGWPGVKNRYPSEFRNLRILNDLSMIHLPKPEISPPARKKRKRKRARRHSVMARFGNSWRSVTQSWKSVTVLLADYISVYGKGPSSNDHFAWRFDAESFEWVSQNGCAYGKAKKKACRAALSVGIMEIRLVPRELAGSN